MRILITILFLFGFLYLGLFVLFNMARPAVETYASTGPRMNFIQFFTGKVQGWGVIYDWRGRVTNRFLLKMAGIPHDVNGNDALTIHEKFFFHDGHERTRRWDVIQTSATSFSGKANDVIGPAKGEVSGAAARWMYKMELPYEGKTITLTMDDWMYAIDGTHVMNRNTFYKFGLPVGTLQIFLEKVE